MLLPSYAALVLHFPAKSLQEVKSLVGGKVDASWITNACALRISRALNGVGGAHALPGPNNAYSLSVVSGTDKKWYAYRYGEMVRYLSAKYAKPSKTFSASAGTIEDKLAGLRGIIAFDVQGWGDATGHIDLWNGTACEEKCYFLTGSPATTKSVQLWEC